MKIVGKYIALFVAVFTVTVAVAWASQSYVVGQKNKQFTVKELHIKVGDKVSFKNEDPFFHNVFSLSPTKTFDLGSYPKGQERTVTFDKAGVVHVECAIHPSMQMTIYVGK